MAEKEEFRAEFAKRLADAKEKGPATISTAGVGEVDPRNLMDYGVDILEGEAFKRQMEQATAALSDRTE